MGPLGSGCVEKYVEYGSVGCDCVLRRIIGVGGDIVGVVLVVEERRAGGWWWGYISLPYAKSRYVTPLQ